MLVIETVPTDDLKAETLCGTDDTAALVLNVVNAAIEYAGRYGFDPKGMALSVVNFNHFPWFKLDKETQAEARRAAGQRIHDIIGNMSPTHLLVCGDRAAENIAHEERAARDRGCPRTLITNKKGITYVSAPDMDVSSRGYGGSDNDIEKCNLLGYTARCLAHGLIGQHPQSLKRIKPKPVLVRTHEELKSVIRKASKAKILAVDTETTLTQPIPDLLTVQISVSEDLSWVIPVTHKNCELPPRALKDLRDWFRRIFGTPRPWWKKGQTFCIGQNFGFDMRVIGKWAGLRYWYMPVWDIQAGEHLLDENLKGLAMLGTPAYNLAQIFASYDNPYYGEAEFSKEDRNSIVGRDLEGSVLDYCAMDTQCMIGIQKAQMERARKTPHLDGFYGKAYKRLMLLQMSSAIRMFSAMKYRGTQVDKNWLLGLASSTGPLETMKQEAKDELMQSKEVLKADKILRDAMGASSMSSLFGGSTDEGRVFDEGKHEHLKTLYMDVMELEPLRHSKTKRPSFDKNFRKAYDNLPVVACVSALEDVKKLRSNYVDSFIKKMEESSVKDGRIRPDFGYLKVVTGRSNSSGPNLQNIPSHGKNAEIIKRMFVAPPGSLHWEADYSVHEIRCWMLDSGDKKMAKVFAEVHDIIVEHRRKQTEKTLRNMKLFADVHKRNYARITGAKLEKVTSTQRQEAKGLTFGPIYGMSDKALAESIGTTPKKAKARREKFFGSFPEASASLSESERFAREHLYLTSVLGRRRHLPGYMVSSRQMAGALDRRARNSKIQGMASDFCLQSADIYSRAVAECFAELRAAGLSGSGDYLDDINGDSKVDDRLPYGPNVMVHDSIKSEARFEHLFLHLHLVEWAMTNGIKDFLKEWYGFVMPVPFDIDIEIGSSWHRKGKWDWSESNRDELVTAALKSHAEIWANGKSGPNPEKTLKKMKRAYAKQAKTLGLDKGRFPLNDEKCGQ